MILKYFEELTAIPRGSGRESAAADWLCAFAERHGLWFMRDVNDNVIIKKQGRGEPVILQGHTDMVWAWDKETAPNADKYGDIAEYFTREGIQLVYENNTLHGTGTSLGADNGVAVAYMLALLGEDNADLPPLECVFTSGEEIGLLGAASLDMSVLDGRRMINLDSAYDDVITAGCAGGCRVKLARTFEVQKAPDGSAALAVTISGLAGGHSGMDAGKGRVNAICELSDRLRELRETMEFELVSFEGGEADNAIPRSAKAVILLASDAQRAAASGRLCGEHISTEECGAECYLAGGTAALALLGELPRGVQVTDDVKGYIIASLNCGVAATSNGEVALTFALRSSRETEMHDMLSRVEACAAAFGFSSARGAAYPGWDYREESPLRDAIRAAHVDLFGGEMRVEVIHAGLECGLFCAALDGLDAVAIGCTVTGLHSPSETLYLESFERAFRLLRATLERL